MLALVRRTTAADNIAVFFFCHLTSDTHDSSAIACVRFRSFFIPLAARKRSLFVLCTPACQAANAEARVAFAIFIRALRSNWRRRLADATVAAQPSSAATTQRLRIFCAHFRILPRISSSSSM